MSRVRKLLFLSMFLLMCASGAEAVPGEGAVSLEFEPQEIGLMVGERQNVTLHVRGSMECLPGFEGPQHGIQVSGQRGARFVGSGGDVYRLEPMPFTVGWNRSGETGHIIDDSVALAVISEVPPSQGSVFNATYWTTGTGGGDCTADGWHVSNAEPETLQIRILRPASESEGVGESPLPPAVIQALVLLVALGLGRRRSPSCTIVPTQPS